MLKHWGLKSGTSFQLYIFFWRNGCFFLICYQLEINNFIIKLKSLSNPNIFVLAYFQDDNFKITNNFSRSLFLPVSLCQILSATKLTTQMNWEGNNLSTETCCFRLEKDVEKANFNLEKTTYWPKIKTFNNLDFDFYIFARNSDRWEIIKEWYFPFINFETHCCCRQTTQVKYVTKISMKENYLLKLIDSVSFISKDILNIWGFFVF